MKRMGRLTDRLVTRQGRLLRSGTAIEPLKTLSPVAGIPTVAIIGLAFCPVWRYGMTDHNTDLHSSDMGNQKKEIRREI